MTCPHCRAPLQRLQGRDGYQVDRCWAGRGRAVVEVRRLDAVYACPRCEFAAVGRMDVDSEQQTQRENHG